MCLKPANAIGHEIAALFAPLPDDDFPAPGARPAPSAPATQAASRRRRLWDLDSRHHCPIIGTCLKPAELRKLVEHGGTDEFTLHVEAAGSSGSRNRLSEAIQRLLERKYAAEVRAFATATDDAGVLALWRQHLARGEVAGPLWAALTHRATSAATGQAIYADIHMLSHQVGAGQAADARRLAWLEAETRRLKAEHEAERRQRLASEATLRQELQTQQARNLRLHSELGDRENLRERLAAYESGIAQIAIGRELIALKATNASLQAAAERGAAAERELAVTATELQALRDERERLEAERDALERLLLPASPPADEAPATCDGDCGNCRSPARRVLCVGGRTALVTQYKALAERLGIRLIHHDGGQEEAISRLPDLINGADAVLCPTDCVSHSAYYRLKHQCKRSGKPCLLFKGAGVSSFAVALTRLADGHADLAVSPRVLST